MIYLFCGTGGVGKTSLSTSFALANSRKKKTVLFTVDPSERLKSLVPVQYSNEPPKPHPKYRNLYAYSFDKRFTFDRLVEKNSPELMGKIQASPLYKVMVESMPQLHEYMAIEEVHHLLTLHRDADLVIDTPPGKHFFDFLDSSDRLINFFNDRTSKILKVISGKGFGLINFTMKPALAILEKLLSKTFLDSLLMFVEALQEMRKSVVEHQSFVKGTLQSDATSMILVTSSEEVLSHNVDFLVKSLTNRPVRFLVVNRDWSTLPTENFKSLHQSLKQKMELLHKGKSLLRVPDKAQSPTDLESLESLAKELNGIAR